METARNFIKLAHSFVIVSLFGGMLLVAGLTVFALSPVSYEDYQAWKAQTVENVAIAEQGSVAGVFSESESIPVKNLLEGKKQKYTSAFLEGVYLLNFEAESANNLPLLRLNHQVDSAATEADYLICLSAQSAVTSSFGITTNNMSQLLELEDSSQHSDPNCARNYLLKLYSREAQEIRFTGNGSFGLKVSKPAAETAITALP